MAGQLGHIGTRPGRSARPSVVATLKASGAGGNLKRDHVEDPEPKRDGVRVQAVKDRPIYTDHEYTRAVNPRNGQTYVIPGAFIPRNPAPAKFMDVKPMSDRARAKYEQERARIIRESAEFEIREAIRRRMARYLRKHGHAPSEAEVRHWIVRASA